MRRGLGLVALVAVLGLVGWWVVRFLDAGTPTGVVPPDRPAAAAATDGVADRSPAPADPAVAAVTREVEAPPPPPEPPPAATAPMPASYRKALSGIRGRLVESDGKPIPGLAVELLELTMSQLMGDFESVWSAALKAPDLSLASGRSGTDGTFELTGALGTSLHGVGIDLGGARGTLRFIDRTLLSGEVTDLGDLVLPPFVTWSGKVVDATGEPIADARIRATLLPPIVFQPGVADAGRTFAALHTQSFGDRPPELIEIPDSLRAWESKLPFPTTRSKADGTFALAGVPQGIATLVVDCAGYTGAWKGPAPTGKRDRDVGTIELSRGRTVTGIVQDATGRPVADAEVIGGVAIPMADLALTFMTKSGPDGRFALEHLSEQGDDLRFAARPNRVSGWTFVSATDGAQPVTITLPELASIDVKLVTQEGAVVGAADLWIRAAVNMPPLLFAPPVPVPAEQVVKVADGHLRVGGLTVGSFSLIGRAPGFAPAFTSVVLSAENHETTLTFGPARDLVVRVTARETGEPIEYADVRAGRNEHEAPPVSTRRTDAAGEARLVAVPAGKSDTVRIRVSHPGYAPQTRILPVGELAAGPLTEANARLDFALDVGAALHARIHFGGAPPTSPVLFTLESRGESRDIDDSVPRFAVPGADGTFTLRGLAPVEARWEVMPRIFNADPQEAMTKVMELRGAGDLSRRGKVTLVAGETVELDIDMNPTAAGRLGRIHGRLRIRGDDGGARYRVEAHSYANQVTDGAEPEQRRFQVDAFPDQPFVLEGLPPGGLNVLVHQVEGGGERAQDIMIHQEFFELDDGEDHALDLEFHFVEARVRVLDRDHQPVPTVGVNFSRLDAGGSSTGTHVWRQTDGDGSVVIKLPQPGRWRATCTAPAIGRGVTEGTFPSDRPLEIKLEPGVPCAGQVEFEPDLDPEATAWLSVMVERSRPGEQSIEQVGWINLEQGERDFEFRGLEAGKYQLQVWTSKQQHGMVRFELPAAGDRNLAPRIRLQQ